MNPDLTHFILLVAAYHCQFTAEGLGGFGLLGG